MKTSREICLTALLRMEKDSGYSNLVLKSMLEKSSLNREDKSFVTRLFYGVIEKMKLIDFNISKLSNRPLSKLDPEIVCILRMGMYQLLFMESVPDNAAVDECVKLCTFAKKKSAGGFVNALLRNKIRENKEIMLPKEKDKSYLSIKYSVDESIISLFVKQYGLEKTEKMMKAFSKQPKHYIRVNTNKVSSEELKLKLQKQNIEIIPLEYPLGCCEVVTNANLTELAEFKNGEFFVQDLASQMCAAALSPEGTHRFLDVCAAPGGKSFNMSISSNKESKIVSCDVSKNRLSLIKTSMERLGLKNIETMVQDATVPNEKMGKYDRILCDVLCSGVGIIGKKPEIRYKKVREKELFEPQMNILKTASNYLEKGGILVYSTCTLNKYENENVVLEFLKQNKDFEPCPLPFSENGEFYITLTPDEYECDGFFISSIRRK